LLGRVRARRADIKKRLTGLPPGTLPPAPRPIIQPTRPPDAVIQPMPVRKPLYPEPRLPIGGPIGPYIPPKIKPSSLSLAEQNAKLRTLAEEEAIRRPGQKSHFIESVGMVTGEPVPKIRRPRKPPKWPGAVLY